MKKIILILLFILGFSELAAAQARQTVKLAVAGVLQGRALSSTTPAISGFVVPAGQYCNIAISMYGLAASGTVSPTARLTTGGNVIFLLGSIPSAVSPYLINASESGILLNAGTYTLDMYAGTWAASSGNLALSGLCFTK
jgi:hypothetical protein